MNFLTMFCLLLLSTATSLAGTYQIDGSFEGCEYGKVYPLSGVGVLECREYKYFYAYSPQVRTDGREVITVGGQTLNAFILDGSVVKTNVSEEFEGCDYDKRIRLDNGLIFVCSTYSYTYSYRPEVMILFVQGRSPEIYINGTKYSGTLYRR